MRILVVSLLAAGVSLLTNIIIERFIAPLTIIDGFAALRVSVNSGIAFSITFHPVVQSILIIVALAAVTGLALRSRHDALRSTGFGLIIGGAIANLIDRLGDGFVTDYIVIGQFPVFNAADTCITIGVALLILHEFLRHSAISRGSKTRSK